MTEQDIIALKNEFPETPKWILTRDWSLDEARDTMQLRRIATGEDDAE